MKKAFLVLSGLLALNFSTISCGDDDRDSNEVTITESQLPNTARTFLATHFSGVSIAIVQKETVADSDGTLYEVKLANGFQVDFDANGNWTGVDGNGKQVPNSIVALIPTSITQYLATNYNAYVITEIQKKTYGYEVQINNQIDLKFNSAGNLI